MARTRSSCSIRASSSSAAAPCCDDPGDVRSTTSATMSDRSIEKDKRRLDAEREAALADQKRIAERGSELRKSPNADWSSPCWSRQLQSGNISASEAAPAERGRSRIGGAAARRTLPDKPPRGRKTLCAAGRVAATRAPMRGDYGARLEGQRNLSAQRRAAPEARQFARGADRAVAVPGRASAASCDR